MRTTDLIAFISYAGIVVSSLIISFYLNRSFGVQIRNKILLWIVIFSSWASLSLCGAVAFFFYNRLSYTSKGIPTPQWVTDTSSYFWLSLFLSLGSIAVLMLTRQTRRYINLERKKR